MEPRDEARDRSVETLRATYLALLRRGLAAGEAANLTARLHGLPSAGVRWTLPEIEAILRFRATHIADHHEALVPVAASRMRTNGARVMDPPNT